MVGGFIGMGRATPNAMANLDVITKEYGNSPKAYLVVPIVGDIYRFNWCYSHYGIHSMV